MKGVETSRNLERIAGLLVGEGYEFACRYYNHNSPSKNLTEFEASALEVSRVQIVSVWENGWANKPTYFDRQRGAFDGRSAMTMAKLFNQPDTAPVYFAVDFDAYRSVEKKDVVAYFEGIAEGVADCGVECPIGVYGGINTLEWLGAEGLVEYFWQAFAPGWSGGRNKIRFDGHLHTIDFNKKVANVDVDIVEALCDDFGGWSRLIA